MVTVEDVAKLLAQFREEHGPHATYILLKVLLDALVEQHLIKQQTEHGGCPL